MSGQRIAFLGASLVRGRVSASFVDLLARERPDDVFLNAGVDGDLAINALRRVDVLLVERPGVVVVLVGTNDVLAASTPLRRAVYRRWKKLPEAASPSFYERSLDEIVTRVKAAGVRCLLATLPPLGEDPHASIALALVEANGVVRRVADRHRVELIDVHGLVAGEIAVCCPQGGRALPRHDLDLVRAAWRRRLLGWSFERIGRANGYRVLSDGVHLAEPMAQRVAALISSRL